MNPPLISVSNLTVEYRQHGQHLPAVRKINLSIQRGETLGIVGESGSGKSTLALALIGLLPSAESRIPSGTIEFEGRNMLECSKEDWRSIRGRRISMIFQDSFAALNPVLTVEHQLQEVIELEEGKKDRERAVQLLRQVRLSEPDRILKSYSHQLSGGQRQRALMAIALARKPDILIADEPTTALDVTVQDEIVKLLKNLQSQLKMALVFVTHNLALVKGLSDNLAVMYAGEIVEYGTTKKILTHPMHPYTRGLLRCIPTLKKSKDLIPVLGGQPPDPTELPSGCPFHPRCPDAFDLCRGTNPEARTKNEIQVRCHLYREEV